MASTKMRLLEPSSDPCTFASKVTICWPCTLGKLVIVFEKTINTPTDNRASACVRDLQMCSDVAIDIAACFVLARGFVVNATEFNDFAGKKKSLAFIDLVRSDFVVGIVLTQLAYIDRIDRCRSRRCSVCID